MESEGLKKQEADVGITSMEEMEYQLRSRARDLERKRMDCEMRGAHMEPHYHTDIVRRSRGGYDLVFPGYCGHCMAYLERLLTTEERGRMSSFLGLTSGSLD